MLQGLLYLGILCAILKLFSQWNRGVSKWEFRILFIASLYFAIAGIIAPGYKQYLWQWPIEVVKGFLS